MRQAKLQLRAGLAALLAGLLSVSAVADDLYIGVGYMEAEFKKSGVRGKAKPDALFVRGGYAINEFVSVEARYGTGISDDGVRVNGNRVKVDLEHMFGAYVRAGLPTAVDLEPYVMLGVTRAEFDGRSGPNRVSDTRTDVSYGFGLDYRFTRQISAGLEYMRYIDRGCCKFTGLSLGVNYHF